MINIEATCSGHYRLRVIRADGSIKTDLSFDNLITDGGLNYMGNNSGYLLWCQVGSGTTAPANADTALANRIAGTNTASNNETIQSTPPYYIAQNRTFVFATGTATGNISEVGVGWATSGSLFSRALIRDAQGNPTTITVLDDESLEVTYQFRHYAPASDISGTFTLREVVHTYTLRAANVTSILAANAWQLANGVTAGTMAGNSGGQRFYDGEIGAITTGPSGATANGAQTVAAYSNNSLVRDHTLTAGPAIANFAGGVGAMLLKAGIGAYQCGFTPKIIKSDVDTLAITLRISWSRRAL